VNAFNQNLLWLLELAAVMQIGIALLNLALPRILRWELELGQVSRLLSEVFHVHSWFISITVAIFGILTWRFGTELAGQTESMGRWLAGCIGSFWAIRVFLQLTYYSSSHWRGNAGRTVIHGLCLLVYGGLSVVYTVVAVQPGWFAPTGRIV
jgi:hypothetical protein